MGFWGFGKGEAVGLMTTGSVLLTQGFWRNGVMGDWEAAKMYSAHQLVPLCLPELLALLDYSVFGKILCCTSHPIFLPSTRPRFHAHFLFD